MLRRLTFWWRYLRGHTPWDTGITPPELVELIETGNLPPGRAIDLGCGTGTNSIYLAKHGWNVVGIDYVSQPIREARRKAQAAGVGQKIRFVVGDAVQLADIELVGPFDLAVDIGCGHSLPPESQRRYAANLGAIVRPGGILLVYMFRPTPQRSLGLEPAEVAWLFAQDFELLWSSCGSDEAAQANSAWYRFRRFEQT